MTAFDAYRASHTPILRERSFWLERIRDRAIAGVPLLGLVIVAVAALGLRIWLYLPH
jgi:hypothetical protein